LIDATANTGGAPCVVVCIGDWAGRAAVVARRKRARTLIAAFDTFVAILV